MVFVHATAGLQSIEASLNILAGVRTEALLIWVAVELTTRSHFRRVPSRNGGLDFLGPQYFTARRRAEVFRPKGGPVGQLH